MQEGRQTESQIDRQTDGQKARPASIEAVAIKHCAAGCVHPLNHQVIQHHLLLSTLHNVLLNTAFCHQPVHTHLHPHRNILTYISHQHYSSVEMQHEVQNY